MPTDDLVEPDTRTSAPSEPSSAPTEPSQRQKGASSLRPLALRLHFYAGVFVAPFILVAVVSGLLYIFTPQLEQALYRHELHVPVGATEQPLAAQIESARAVHPEGEVRSVRPGPGPTDTTRVIFDHPEESFYRTVFVDPYTAEVRGELDTYGSGSQALPVRTWIDLLHRRLHMGEVGRLYSEVAASWLWVVVAGGLVLWWNRRRKDRAFRSLTTPDLKASGRRRTMSWHGAVGVWVALVLFFLSATGLTWSRFAGENVTALREAMSWTTPTVSAAAPHHGGDASAAEGHGDHAAGGHGGHAGGESGGAEGGSADADADQVLAAARSVGVDAPVQIDFPAETDGAYVVQRVQQSWPVREDTAAVDPATGEVLEVLRFDDYPLMAKLSTWGINAHMGVLFGLVNQLVLAAVAIALIVMIILGYRMWWQRRPTREAFGFGRPLATRGAWRKASPKVLIPIVAFGLFAAWFLPVFGVTLAAFLVIDGVIGWRARRSSATG